MSSIAVHLIRAPFGRFRLAAWIGDRALTHFLLFDSTHKDRAEAQAARIEDVLARSKDPLSELDPALWQGPGASEKVKGRVFKPSAS